MATIIEPFRIKMVEPLAMTSRPEREEFLRKAHYNLFNLHGAEVLIDLLTDSGTSAMSSLQWSGMMRGDETYAGSESYFVFERAVRDIFGHEIVIPTHQGRASERILFSELKPGEIVPNNTHFDTTRANIEATGATAMDLPIAEAKVPVADHPFKGNMDVQALANLLESERRTLVPMVLITVTNNSCGGQPVSMANLRAVSGLCRRQGVPFYIDACRFAENAWFIKQREPGYKNKTVTDIAREMFSLADGALMSAKKDAFANIGGILTTNDQGRAGQMRNLLVQTEGFPTYGGLAGRDLEAIAQGLCEVLDEDYLAYRVRSVQYLAEKLEAVGISTVRPAGGHAVYIDAAAFLPHVRPNEYPGQALACELYLAGGVRTCEIGSLMFGKANVLGGAEIPAALELVRLAIPRRVYTQSHIDYVAEIAAEVYGRRKSMSGFRIVEQAPRLRHFTAKLAPIA